jgi:hypothetical protein
MEHIMKESNTTMGQEFLYFPEAEVKKIKGAATSFATMGPLSVLYFKDYHRFILQINDWRYPLLRRLPVIADKEEVNAMTFILPAMNGFSFILKVNNVANMPALTNLETILHDHTRFSFKGEDMGARKMEASPDDKLTRHQMKDARTGLMEMGSEKIKEGIEKIKIKKATIEASTLNLTSKKRRSNLKEIINKDFKTEAKSTFKKDFFETSKKKCDEFYKARRENYNMTQVLSMETMMKVKDTAKIYVNKNEVEETILRGKDMADNYMMKKNQEKKGIMEFLKQGIHDIKESINGMIHNRQNMARAREDKTTDTKDLPVHEGLTHSEG